MTAPLVSVTEVDAGVRPVRLRLPFRFGAMTLTQCPQLFVRVRARVDGREATGHAAEMMVPRWFDKRPERTLQDNVMGLSGSLQRAIAAYRGDAPASAFGLFERHYAPLMQAGAAAGDTALSAAYGQAVLDRAVLDAVCTAAGASFFEAAAHNLPGIGDSDAMPDLDGWDWSAWLRGLTPLRTLAARHTVGLLDALAPVAADAGPGGPVSLPAAIARHGLRFFKIKLGGEPAADAARLGAVLDVLDTHAAGHRFSLDGNEQYADGEALRALFDALRPVMDNGGGAGQRRSALLYIEQPLARERSLHAELPWRDAPAPLLMDEADGNLGDWPQGRALGWWGVSSKSCKGLYKALINRARVDQANGAGGPARCFMSAEDLTCQPGLSVQQDLALAALLGLAHCERNGHHYGPGFGDTPADEATAFAEAHPDLYAGAPPQLAIHGGQLRLDSLFQPGFAHRAAPDWQAMQPLADCTALV